MTKRKGEGVGTSKECKSSNFLVKDAAGGMHVQGAGDIPALYCANAAEFPWHSAVVHSFSTDKVDPSAPMLLMLPMMIVHVVATQNTTEPCCE